VVIVLGDLRCAEMYSYGGLCVLGDTIVGGTMLQHYNDWVFECLGKVSARAFVSEDKATTFARERSVIEYYTHDHGLEETRLDAFAWLALDGEEGAGEHVEALRNAYANGRDPLPPPPDFDARAKAIGEFDAWQRAIAEGRLNPAAAVAKLSDPAWAWEMATLWPRRCWNDTLLAQALGHASERVRACVASRLKAADAFAKLSADASAAVRAETAVNPACPDSFWPALARDADAKVRANLVYGRYAVGQLLPIELQALLARDADVLVRRAMAVLPDLDAQNAALLRDDADVVVRKRVNALQPVDAATLMRQIDDPDASVRANLASAAAKGRAPFDMHRELCAEVTEKLLFDPAPNVRRAAAMHFPPPFIEAHQEKLAADTVAEVRALVAEVTRDAVLQRRLAEDAEEKVRLAVIANPHALPDVLMHFARTLPTGGLLQIGEGISELARHPRLPMAAAEVLHDRMPSDSTHLFDEQPNMPVRDMVARLCHDVPYEPGEWEYDDYQRCRAAFPELIVVEEALAESKEGEGLGARLMSAGMSFPRRWYHKPLLFVGIFVMMFGAMFKTKRKLRRAAMEGKLTPADDAALDALFHHMLDSKLFSLNGAALGNARCPPERLAKYIADYLARTDDGTDYLVERAAANPALPEVAKEAIAQRLVERHDYELRKGFMRNPTVSAELLRRLIAEGEGDTSYEARRALWSWHGEWTA
jgi:hypothetical protein